jgi:hypothetical protein
MTTDEFHAALDRYSATFQDQGLPFLRESQVPEDQPLVIGLLDQVMALGQPLPWWGIMAALGFPPPPNVCL